MKKPVPSPVPMPRKDHPNVLPLEGEIDLHVSPAVTAAINTTIEKKPKQLVIDLSRVTYIDSAGLATFIEGMQKVEAYGGKFALAGLQGRLRPKLNRIAHSCYVAGQVDD